MAELAKKLKTPDTIETVYSATIHIMDCLQPKSSLLVAVTIIGRQPMEYRDGMIFLAYDLGLKEMARDYANIALNLIDRAMRERYDGNTRYEEALMECHRIVEQLMI